MLEKITTSLLLNGLHDLTLNSSQKANLRYYQLQLLNSFQRVGNASSREIAEIVTLAITQDEDQYKQILNSYVLFLQTDGRIIEGYHVQGLADILSLAQMSRWISKSHGEQILKILLDESKNGLLNPTNKDTAERYQCLSLWQHVLFVLTEAGTEITQAQKEQLQSSFEAYRKYFKGKEETNSDEVGLSLVELAQQSLLHVKDDSAPLWQRAGLKTLSAVKNMTLSVAALGAIPVTFGLSSLGAIAPGFDAIGDITGLVKDIYQHIKERKETKQWYQELLKWRSLFVLSIHYKQEAAFKTLMDGFIGLTDKSLKLTLAHGLVDTLTQILIGYPGEEYKTYHEQCYLLMRDCLYTLDNQTLESKLFAATMGLLESSSLLNMEFVKLWVEYLARKESEFIILPLTPEFIAGVKLFYLTLEQMKQKSQDKPVELKKWIDIQAILISRLASGYVTEKNEESLQALCELEADDRVQDKKPVNNGLEIIRAQVKVKDKIDRVRQDIQRRLQAEITRASFMLIVWKSLPQEKQSVLAEIFKLYGVDISVEMSSKEQSSLLGEVGNLIIPIAVSKSGLQINKPPQSEEELAALQMILDDRQKGNQVKNHKEDKPRQLAKKVDFAFIGSYVEGIQLGESPEILGAAMQLAEQRSSKKNEKQLANNNSGNISSSSSHAVSKTFRPSISTTASSSKTSQGATSESSKENLIQYVIEKHNDEEDYVIKIKYTGLSIDIAQKLQEILESDLGVKASTKFGEPKRNRGNYITELRFYEQEHAKLLETELKSAIKNKHTEKLVK